MKLQKKRYKGVDKGKRPEVGCGVVFCHNPLKRGHRSAGYSGEP